MPTLVSANAHMPPVAASPANAGVMPPATLTLSFLGVQFDLTPADASSQVAYKTNAQGRIVLDLQNFSGSLQVSSNAPVQATTTASPSTTTRPATAKVEEEPNSPETNAPALAAVTPGQQKLSFEKKKSTKKTSKSQQARKRLSDVSNTTTTAASASKKSKKDEVAMGQYSMEVPTQDACIDMSQTMPSEMNSTRSSSMEDHRDVDMVVDEDAAEQPKETVQEILERVNSSNDSIVPDEEEEETKPDKHHTPAVPESLTMTEQETKVTAPKAALENDLPEYSTPSPRWGHSMTKISEDRVLVYGGQSFDLQGKKSIILSDIHIYNMSKKAWEKPVNCRAEARQWHAAAYLPERGYLLAFGGESYDQFAKNSLKVLDTEIMLWFPPSVTGDIPTGRSGHSVTLIPNFSLGASKARNGSTRYRSWTPVDGFGSTPKISGSAPKPRSYHSTTAVISGDGYKLVIFGGNNKTHAFNTVHVLERVGDDEWKWTHPSVTGQAPFPRTGHSATLLEDGKTICIYGGWDPNEEEVEGEQENIFKSSYLLDTETWAWTSGPKAIPGGSGTDVPMEDCGNKRCGHTAAIHPETGEVLVFGGRIPGEVLAGDFQRLVTSEEK
eukprot:CAMPEP_0176014590 /NCGR_PEP_ID=MMETSP0120_2-20121206/6902_1 /TAXON_ID=160619 /ORGANISM="Kryptoperidinium foliaceum, Strain CCMP 1326" /LENGTH=610 /DNA_ID=CAMNT_0017347537 /DNA_START=59 /DNA_END=1891 /DNA_ORIENTATION=-